MKVGYSNGKDNPIDNENCPICGNNIYVSKYGNDYRCTKEGCPLKENTAYKLYETIGNQLNMMLINFNKTNQEILEAKQKSEYISKYIKQFLKK